ncbi:hypothetical protein LVJ85_00580 [Neisseria sp. Dent CA1/247]|uniref:hypothetical protein n=1 Tax=Neisseria sp. Dent CA1/247 TaxID=2912675 RepID=UPI001FCFC307|nr:hypothetical protein [Neisseria sp. Dent CA1/247]UOO77051.1 hypothetical protein LVJ85_00580 [Neisseria sp. Dent CA1/247]
MEEDIRSALKDLGLSGIDEIISGLRKRSLLEDAWKRREDLKKFLEKYGSFRYGPRLSMGSRKKYFDFSES